MFHGTDRTKAQDPHELPRCDRQRPARRGASARRQHGQARGRGASGRQDRYPFSRTRLEVPAGKLEPGEAPELAAARELSEETGLTAGRMQYLGANFTSPGYSEEVRHIYLARDLHRGAAHLDPGEFLNVERHPLEELVQMALDGELCDGKTTVALLKTQLLLARERGEAASGGL